MVVRAASLIRVYFVNSSCLHHCLSLSVATRAPVSFLKSLITIITAAALITLIALIILVSLIALRL